MNLFAKIVAKRFFLLKTFVYICNDGPTPTSSQAKICRYHVGRSTLFRPSLKARLTILIVHYKYTQYLSYNYYLFNLFLIYFLLRYPSEKASDETTVRYLKINAQKFFYLKYYLYIAIWKIKK